MLNRFIKVTFLLLFVAGILLIPAGDLNGDNKIDNKDYHILLQAYNTTTTNPNYNPQADMDNNGKINIYDLTTFTTAYNQHNTPPTIWITPLTTTIKPGDTLQLKIMIDPAGTPLTTATLEITADPNTFTLTKITDGPNTLLENPDNTNTLPLKHGHTFHPTPTTKTTFITLELKTTPNTTCKNQKIKIQNPTLLDTNLNPLPNPTTRNTEIQITGCNQTQTTQTTILTLTATPMPMPTATPIPMATPTATPTPTAMVTPMPTATPIPMATSELTISTGDGLKLTLDANGNITGIAINDSIMPLLETRGGFSFREVLTDAPNLLPNPGFEDGTDTPLKWNLVKGDGTISWDSPGHTGTRSIKISLKTTGKSGYPKSEIIPAKPLHYYTLSAWGKVNNSKGYRPAVRVVELDKDKKWIKQTNLGFKNSEWEQKQIVFKTAANTRYLYVYANIWKGSGTFWLDDVEIKQFFGPTIHPNSTLTRNPDGTITQKAQANDLDFTFTYIPRERYIEIQGEIQDLRGEDRALQITFNLPLNASGWRWGDYIRRSRTINESTHYENVYKIGETRTQSVYPFASIDNNTHGLSIAVPMDIPRIYRTGYDLKDGYSIQYDFGLSNQTLKIGPGHANFTFVVYKTDEPEWGFRAVVKKYYELYPRFFEKRNEREGLWTVNSYHQMSITNVSDFGFAFDEWGTNIPYNILNGIYSFTYTEPWGWWRSFGNNSKKPTYKERTAVLDSDILNGDKLWKSDIYINEIASAVKNSALYDENGKMYLDATAYFWNYWGSWKQNYPTNPDPDIPSPNRFEISYREYQFPTKQKGGFIDYWTFGANCSWDDKVSHNNSGHSAKISLQTNRTDIISGVWKSDYVEVLPNTEYIFSAWIKTENAYGTKPAIRLVEIGKNNKPIYIKNSVLQHNLIASEPSSDWTFKSLTFTTNQNTTKMFVYANIWKGNGTGWFDDVSIIKKGSTENLLKNGGFEKNVRGDKTKYHVDGIYVDSIVSNVNWGALENYRKEHWKYTDEPLVFGYNSKQPTLLMIFSQYEYLANITGYLHNKNKLVMGNIFPYAYGFYAHKLDVLGSEIGHIESDDISSYRRTMSYHKTNTNLMKWRWGENEKPISHEDIKIYIKNEMFYGIFPSIYGAGRNRFDNYWFDDSLYERDRDLFSKYIPIIKELSNAGWEPIPYALADNKNLKIERYGRPENNNVYFTIKNDQLSLQRGNVTFYLSEIGFNTSSKVKIKEMISGTSFDGIAKDGNLKLQVNIAPKDVLVYNIVSLNS